MSKKVGKPLLKHDSIAEGLTTFDDELDISVHRRDTDITDLSENIEHKRIYIKSKKSVIPYVISTFGLVTFGMWIRCIWILYSREFEYSMNNSHVNDVYVPIILYVGYFIQALSTLINGILSDIYGCDIMMFVIIIIWILGELCMSIAYYIDSSANNNFASFLIYCIGWIIFNFGGGYVTVTFAYIAKMLPHNISISIQGQAYAIVFVAVTVGPIISGVISHFTSYHISFIIVTILNAVLLVYFLYTMYCKSNDTRNNQKELIMEQKQFISIYEHILSINKNGNEFEGIIKDHFFPMCTNNDKNTSIQDANDKISTKTWIKFIGALLQFSLVNSNEVVFDNYFTVYLHDRFNKNIFDSTLQLSLTSIFLIIGFAVLPEIYKCYPTFADKKLYLMVILYIILIFALYQVFPVYIDKQWMYWIVLPIYNSILAILMMNVEILSLELQPKKYSGIVNGVRGFLKQLFSAFLILMISLLWNKNNDYVWMWHGSFIFMSSAFICFILSYGISFFC